MDGWYDDLGIFAEGRAVALPVGRHRPVHPAGGAGGAGVPPAANGFGRGGLDFEAPGPPGAGDIEKF